MKGALGLVTKLTAALQPREGVIDAGKAGDGHAKGEGPLKAAVIATARHLSGTRSRVHASLNKIASSAQANCSRWTGYSSSAL